MSTDCQSVLRRKIEQERKGGEFSGVAVCACDVHV